MEALKAYKVIQELAEDMTYELSYVFQTGRLELWEQEGNLLDYIQLEKGLNYDSKTGKKVIYQ